jgi:hypothetical protein
MVRVRSSRDAATLPSRRILAILLAASLIMLQAARLPRVRAVPFYCSPPARPNVESGPVVRRQYPLLYIDDCSNHFDLGECHVGKSLRPPPLN